MLNHAEAVASLRDDPTLTSASREELEAEVAALLGDDDPLAVALVIEEAQRLGPRPPPGPKRTGGEGCRLENDCGGREPVAGNGRCMTCGADRGGPDGVGEGHSLAELKWLNEQLGPPQLMSDTQAPEEPRAPLRNPPATVTPSPALIVQEGTLTGRVKAALGLTDSELAQLIGVSRPTANAYASGRLPEIIDAIRAEYLLRAMRKRAELMSLVEAELQHIVALGD